MKVKILVLYYSQSGQLRQILNSLVKEINADSEIDFAAIEPQVSFPFPWNADAFFDAMPETVEHISIPLKPLPAGLFEKNYDLILFGWQPWFLNPSQPILSFLKSYDARILKGKNIVTIAGSRNMWLHGQEVVKEHLINAGSNLVGNIVLTDRNTNLVSLLTIIRWSFTGKKEATKYLPEAGVSQQDIRSASRFGKIILEHANQKNFEKLHPELLENGAVNLNSGLVLLEQRGIKNFRYWAKYIREKGGPGAAERKSRVNLFKQLLMLGIFVLSPVSSLTASIQQQLKKKRLQKDVAYFRGIGFEEGKL